MTSRVKRALPYPIRHLKGTNSHSKSEGVSTWEWVSIEAPNCAIAQSLMLPFYTPGRCPGPWPCCSSSPCSDDGRWWGWCSCQTRCEWSPEWEDLSQRRWRLLLRPISEPKTNEKYKTNTLTFNCLHPVTIHLYFSPFKIHFHTFFALLVYSLFLALCSLWVYSTVETF